MSPTENVEEKLFDIGKWAFLGVQFIGYVPLKVENQKLKFSWLSIPVISCIILVLVSAVWNVIFFLKHRAQLDKLFDYGSTESFAHYLMGMVLTISSFLLKISGLLGGKSTVKFWRETINLVKTFYETTAKNSFAPNHMMQNDAVFCKRARICTRNLVIFHFSVGFIHTFYSYGLCTLTKGKYCHFSEIAGEENSWDNLFFYIGQTIWTLTIMLHVGHSVWMMFFIRIYKIGFRLICLEIQNITYEAEKATYSSVDTFIVNLKSSGVISNSNKMEWGLGDVSIDDSKYPFVEERIISAISKEKGMYSPAGAKRYKGKGRMTPIQEEKLNQCLDTYLCLEDQVENFNRHFGPKLILEMIICISVILSYLFFAMMYFIRNDWKSVISVIAPFATFAGELLFLASTCNSMTSHASSILRHMQSLPFASVTKDTKMKLQLMACRLASNPPTISGSNFFTMNRTLVTSILSALATYLIVLLQFEFDSSKK